MNQIINTIRLLRIPFSLFLLPVTIFSFYFIQPGITSDAILLTAIWHLLVFPSSNGFNSYNDMDEGPIGGLFSPPQPTRQLLYAVNFLDLLALLLSLLLNAGFAAFVFLYIISSRLYSDRAVRIKQFPVASFLLVFFFQGAWIFCANVIALGSVDLLFSPDVISAALASSFLIGAMYPITQIYQHQTDEQDGTYTISMMLGKKATFIFSGCLFFAATILLTFSFWLSGSAMNSLLFITLMFPALAYFVHWAVRSYDNPNLINFRNTMTMLIISALFSNTFFLIVLIM